MITDRRMTYIRSEDGFDYYLFKPTLFRQYYNKKEPWTEHRSLFTHKLHMLYYLLRGGYSVLYMMKGSKMAAYIVYTRAGNDIVEGTTKEDLFSIYITTTPEYRRLGLATKLVNEMLHLPGLQYRYSYKTIAASNSVSQKVAASNGYILISKYRKEGLFNRVVKDNTASSGLYQVKGVDII